MPERDDLYNKFSVPFRLIQMPTYLRNIDFVKTLRLKQVGIALASLWLIVLVAAVASTIYREFDGPTVRSTVAENLNLTATNSTLSANLESARNANEVANGTIDRANGKIDHANGMIDRLNGMIDRLNADLMVSQFEHANLERWLESYLSFAPLAQIGPNSAATLDLLSLP